jgi:N6-L-threonylcarbamoyladenine synthase
MRILSIETSCDDTAAAVIEYDGKQAAVLANTVSSQTIHTKWGGVVPNLASREHMKNIVPVIEEALACSKKKPADIDLIAVTEGPGLMPALIVGVSAAKTLALVWKKPLIGVQHLEGHIYANLLGLRNDKSQISNFPASAGPRQGGGKTNPNEHNSRFKIQDSRFNFPLLALIVSGGHTELVLMQKHFDYTILGETQDDAAGEAFDKVAKLLGLAYPGGPIVAKRADSFRDNNNQSSSSKIQKNSKIKNPESTISFPRPMIHTDDFDFSFSGLKTSVLYFLKKHAKEMKDEKFIDAVCYEFQEAVVDVLVEKTKKALELYSPQTLVIAGGVSANVRLRERLQSCVDSLNLDVKRPSEGFDSSKIAFLTPEFSYSLDNAAMIGIAAALRYEHMDEEQKKTLIHTPLTLDPDANLPLQNL